MAVTTITDPRVPVGPVGPGPIDPTNCPACLSGLQPVDPPYEEVITPKY